MFCCLPKDRQQLKNLAFTRLKIMIVKSCFTLVCQVMKSFMGCIVFWNHLSQASQKSYCSLADELLLCLMKLHLGTKKEDLAIHFNITNTCVSKFCHKWIDMMSVELKCLVCWPDHEVLHDNMLSCFQIHFSKVVYIIYRLLQSFH